MSNVLEYKCPNCSGAIQFDANLQKMKCPYCDTEFEMDAVKAFNEAVAAESGGDRMDWESYNAQSGNGDWQQGEADTMVSYVCTACGGEIVGDQSMGASSCPYCGNPAIIAKQFSGMLRPDMVIPFQKDKNAAKQALRDFLKGKPLLPKLFRAEHRLDSIAGIYVPYWLFNCKTDANMRFNATRVSAWNDSKYSYTRTDHYMLTRAGNLTFERIPVDGSTKMEDRYTEAVEPFDYSAAVDFQTAYLSGFLADKYDLTAAQCIERANERIRQSTTTALTDTTMGYATCIPAGSTIHMEQGDIRYALLPLWVLNTKYKNQLYTFAMNGQTGRFVGELPVDWTRFWLWFTGIAVGAGALIAAIAFLLF